MNRPSSQPHAAYTDDTPRERLLGAAADLFCRRGINAVGIEAVLKKAGAAKSTLYKSFGSKEALVDAVLDREGRAWRDWFIGALDKGSIPARRRLDRIAPLLASWFLSGRFYGCPFINAIGEHDKADDRLRRQALAHKRVVLDRISMLLREAGAARPAMLSHQIGIIMDGAIVAALVTRDAKVGKTAGAALTCLLDANLPKELKESRRGGAVSSRANRQVPETPHNGVVPHSLGGSLS